MTDEEMNQAALSNADLRKKLRVDRIRKQQMGGRSTMSIEDPSQPEWMKFKSLKEIELLRESKKENIINSVMADFAEDQYTIHVIPGIQSFFELPLHNPFATNEVFTIVIQDPDQGDELILLRDPAEWRHWSQ